jgi:hypothetical protein
MPTVATTRSPAALAPVLAGVFAILITVYAVGSFHKNAWTIIDDHEILSWFGSADRIGFSDFGRLLATTEVLDPTRATRFRPVYFVVRIAQAALLGKDVTLWYATHALIIATSVFLLAWAVIRYLVLDWAEAVVALAGMALVVSRYYWADTFNRLGPAEAYAILGSSLALLGFVARFAGGDRRHRWYWASIAGTLFAAGSKENLLVLAVPLATLAILDWRELTWLLRVAFACALLLLVADGLWVLRIVAAAGRDIYGNSAALGGRLTLAGSFLRRPEVAFTGVGALAVASAAVAWRKRHGGKPPPEARTLLVLSVILAACLALAATQYVFYAGKIPARSRYDFPYILAFDFALLASAFVALRIARRPLSRVRFSVTISGPVAVAILVAIVMAYPAYAGLRTMREDARWLRRGNRLVQARLARAVELLERTPGASVVLHARRGIDYEPVMSIQRHLAARHVSAPIFLTIAPEAEGAAESDWEVGLLAAMRRWSAEGFESIRALPPEGAGTCIGFGFHGPPPNVCASGVAIWPVDVLAWERGE